MRDPKIHEHDQHIVQKWRKFFPMTRKRWVTRRMTTIQDKLTMSRSNRSPYDRCKLPICKTLHRVPMTNNVKIFRWLRCTQSTAVRHSTSPPSTSVLSLSHQSGETFTTEEMLYQIPQSSKRWFLIVHCPHSFKIACKNINLRLAPHFFFHNTVHKTHFFFKYQKLFS